MAQNLFLISDTHFGHENICNFLCKDGITKLRPFSCAAEMDEAIVKNWNSVVRPNDRVYVLGDVAIKRANIATISRCYGKKVLIKGNHDIFQLEDYLPHFEDIRGVNVMKARDGILSHIPLHPDSIGRFGINIHGHIHEGDLPDSRYFSVCCENIGYTPISYEDLKVRVQLKREALEHDKT